ncbi:MAG: choice-of-anchor tandem repeat NxxGxxAF-containing protein, partial [Acidobacteriota bacterium]
MTSTIHESRSLLRTRRVPARPFLPTAVRRAFMNRRSRPSIARIRSSALLAALTATVFAAAIASAQDIRVIAITGGPTPFGAYEDVSRCAMAGDRTVVFTARTDNVDTGTTDSIFLWQNDALQRIVFENQIVQGSYQINTFLNAGQTVPAANSSGSVAFTAEFEAIGGGIDSDGVFVYDSTVGSIRPIVRDGDPAPDGNGFLGVSLGNHPAINDAHQVAVVASVFGAAGGLGNGSGLVGRHLQFHAVTGGRGVFRREALEPEVFASQHPFLNRSIADFLLLPEGVSDLPKGGMLRFSLPQLQPVA